MPPLFDIHRRSAARIFNVPEDQVTNEQRGRAKTIDFASNFGSEIKMSTRIVPPITVMKTWGDCPDCKQSATGVHNGHLSCTRCGWTAGGSTMRRALI